MTTVVLIAKNPVPGRVKTRLQPELSPAEAADFAAACIQDTIDVLRRVPASRRVLLYDSPIAPHGADGFEVLRQSDGSLDERLAAAFDALEGPTLLVGMDTPQLRTDDIARAFDPWPTGIDAFFGPAEDGGFWALGMREPRGDLIRGVPMSRDDTGALQFQRLRDAGLTTAILPRLNDVDTWADARRVALESPRTHAAAFLSQLTRRAVAA